MKRLVLVLVAASLSLPGAARAAACSPLNCAPSQFALAGGSLLGFRSAALQPVTVVDLRTGEKRFTLPGGFVAANVLVHQAGRTLTWYDASRGVRTHVVRLGFGIRLAGVSQSGDRAVGFRLVPDGATTIVIASPRGVRQVVVPGRQWDFDALRGTKLFLIRYLTTGGYQVRLLDLSTGRLAPEPLKDPHESDTIWGIPFERLASDDGRYLFTLYVTSNGAAMVHQLDLQTATARCIDLPGTGDYGSASSWALALAPGGRTLWAASPGYGRIVAIDVARHVLTRAFRIDLPYWSVGNGTRAALSPDGKEFALADGQSVALVDLAAARVANRTNGKALALGYSPQGRLWRFG